MSTDFSITDWIWRDGEFVRWEDATIHVMSHVVHYGSSVFEGIRCYKTPDGAAIFRLGDHLSRLRESCRLLRMDLPYDEAVLVEACKNLVRHNNMDECYIRPVVLRGMGTAGIHPGASPIETYLICWPWGAYLGEEALDQGVDVCVSSWSRPAPNTHPAMAKVGGNYINAQLIKMEAVTNGYSEAIALAPDGLVSEASGQNLFLVRGGTLITPQVDGSILCGITRDCVLTLARDMGIPTTQQTVPREMLYSADELFLTGTASEVTPIRSVDRMDIGTGGAGPVTRALQRQLLSMARGEAPDIHGWRTPVGQGKPKKEIHAA
jgi:branched-chain amino acid aminotransferase